MRIEADDKTGRRGLGDALSRVAVRQLQEATLFGNDVDPRMVRLATMNLSLRGLDRVRILRRNALTRSLDRSAKAKLGPPVQGFDVVLANPPFSGGRDSDRIVEDVKIGRTRQTELLFAKISRSSRSPPVLPAQPTNLLMFFGAQAVGALARVAISLRDPVSYRLGRRLELPSQVSRCTSGPNQLDHLLSECRRVRRSRLRHRGLLLAKRTGVPRNWAKLHSPGVPLRTSRRPASPCSPTGLTGLNRRCGTVRLKTRILKAIPARREPGD
ncbi:MAG: N-6 DNA methylase [Acidobacteria bacterium]|nr:N-6 DNA methylase [Acidobacteriota bacterium]